MARYDKYDPISGGFRAPLAADFASGDLNTVFGVGLDANGAVVKGAGTSGVSGVLVLTKTKKAGDIVDVMTHGEIVELGGTAGRAYHVVAATGVAAAAANTGVIPAGSVKIGTTVEANRLVVRLDGRVA